MTWLCQCGNGSLHPDSVPPTVCPVCGFPWAEYLEELDNQLDEVILAAQAALN